MKGNTADSNRAVDAIRIRGLTKYFPGVRALDNIDLDLREGEVHVLIGENGAGKSTLMKVLAGLQLPDQGGIEKRGEVLRLRSPRDAIQRGIAMIHQELMPFRQMTVAENVFVGQEPARFGFWVDRPELDRSARRVLERLKSEIPPSSLLGKLSLAEMQLVEIARALAQNADVIIMDEPTSSLSDTEVSALFEVIRDLKQRGVTILYTSHKMEEVFSIGDTVTVLRDGKKVGTYRADSVSEAELIRAMVGRELASVPSTRGQSGPRTLLAVHRLSRRGVFENISLNIQSGEILGVAGLVGAGRTGLLSALFGLEPADGGEVRMGNKLVKIRCPQDAIRLGIGFVSEDRRRFGLVPQLSVRSNVTLANLEAYSTGAFVSVDAEARATDEQVRSLDIRSDGQDQSVEFLSGGNQQKVLLARMLLVRPEILLLDEPTRGIDVASKAEIHALIRRLTAEGVGVLLVSSELPELLTLSDRLIVMRSGRLTAELDPRTTSQEEIMGFAMLRS